MLLAHPQACFVCGGSLTVAAHAPGGWWCGLARPAAQPRDLDAQAASGLRHPIALRGPSADRCTCALGGLHTAVRCHHRTPPVALGAP